MQNAPQDHDKERDEELINISFSGTQTEVELLQTYSTSLKGEKLNQWISRFMEETSESEDDSISEVHKIKYLNVLFYYLIM